MTGRPGACGKYGIRLDEFDDAARRNTEQSGFSVMNLGAAVAALIGVEQESCVRGADRRICLS